VKRVSKTKCISSQFAPTASTLPVTAASTPSTPYSTRHDPLHLRRVAPSVRSKHVFAHRWSGP